MYRQSEEQPTWGQGQAQGQQQPQGQQQWQQSPIGQQTPQNFQQSSAPQQYMPGNAQGSEQTWSQPGPPQQAPFQQGAPMYMPGPQGSQADAAWQNAPPQQQGGQGWQGGPQGQYTGQGGRQQQPTALPDNRRSWVGAVTQLIPPNYGIVDGNAFYVEPVVVGRIPGVGDRVACEAVPNTDGGMYEWRVLRVEMVQATALTRMPPNQAQQTRSFAIPHNRLVAGKARGSPARASPTRSPAYNASPAHGPSAVPSKPLGGFGKEPVKQEAPAAVAEPFSYNQMAPPVTAYTAEYALAKASAAMDGNRHQAIPPPQPDRRPFFSGQARELDEEAAKRSAAAAQQLGSAIGNPTSIGAKLMSKMGFGVAGQGLGRSGQGIVAPVEAIKMGQGQGLGFAAKQRNRSPDRDRPARRRPRARTPPRRRPRSRSASPRSRSRSPGAEFRGRYRVEPPKFLPRERERGVAALSKRYRNLYIPADFCHLSATWVDSLPEWDPLPLTHQVSMNIAKAEKHAGDGVSEAPEDKEETSVEEHAASAAATDTLTTGKRWSARVVLMSGVNARLLHNSSVKVFQHPLKKLQFLTGRKGRSEPMLIGGAWDPVDGADPAHSPSALLATAIRTFLAATGIDLSAAVHWTKFAHLRYLRKSDPEEDIEENVVVYLVDAHELAVPDQDAKDVLAKAASAATTEIEAKKALDAAEEEEKSAEVNFQLLGSQDVPLPPDIGDNLTITPAEMTVAALQEALSKRGLDTKWKPLKSKKELVDRLQEYVNTKRKEHAALDKDYKAYEDARKALEAAKAGASAAKDAVKAARAAVLEALKTVSDPPATEMVQIQANKAFVGSKESFHAEVSTLDTLLGYTEKDDWEGAFEAAVFAELFREMLEARFGRGILRALELLERGDRQARAKKAEERRAKKAAEAAAKAKAKEPAEGAVEGDAKARADAEAEAGAKGADLSVTGVEAAPEQAGAGTDAKANAASAVGSSSAVTAALAQAGEAGKAGGQSAAGGKPGEAAAAALDEGKEEDAMELGAAHVAAEAGEAAGGEAQPAAPELATENGTTAMAEAKEAETAQEVAKGEGVQNSDGPAAAVLSSKKDLPAKPGAPGTSDAMKHKLAASSAAPASQGAPVKVLESSAAPIDAKAVGGKPENTTEAANQSKGKRKESDMDRKEAGEKSDKAQKKGSENAKEDKAALKSKKKEEKPKGKERERERDRAKEDGKEKGRSRDDRGRSSREEPPSKRAKSDRDKDSSSKCKEDSSRKSETKAAENGQRTRGSERAKEQATDSRGPDKNGGSAKKGDSKKRPSSGLPKPDAKEPKTEKQPEAGTKPPGTPKEPSAAGDKLSGARLGTATAGADATPPKVDTAPAALTEPAAPPAIGTGSAGTDSAAPSLQPPAVQSVSHQAEPAPQLQALPPPEPRWQSQPTPFLLACRYFDRDLAGYIEAADLEEILVMVSNNVSRRRVQNLVDVVVKRGKMSYMEQHAALEVPAVLPPERTQQAAAELAHPGIEAHTGTSAPHFGQSLQLAKDMELSMLHRKLAALAKSEAGLRKSVGTMEGEKAALDRDRASLDRKRAGLEKDVALLTERLSEAQAAARREAEAMAARGSQATADISRTLEDISAAEKGLVAAKEKLIAMSAEVAAHRAARAEQQPTCVRQLPI